MVVIVFALLGSLWLPFEGDLFHSSDTLELELVEVLEFPWEKYTLGQRVKNIERSELESFQGRPLSEFLQRRTGIFVREYGPGMLSTVNLRGTAAGHTAVFWNGLPINSPSLGQMDFSLLTVGSCDAIQVQFGGSGALFGTDAIGGTVHLGSKPSFDKGHQTKIRAGHGSFGLWQNQVTHSYSNRKLYLNTRAYFNRSANRFPFRNLGRSGTPIEIQEHASVENWGLVQDAALNLGANTQVSSSFWYQSLDREVLPVMGSTTRDIQQDANLRWVADLNHFRGNLHYNLKLGYVKDDQLFNVTASNITHQYLAAGEVNWEASQAMGGRSGLRYTHVVGELSTYFEKEDRLELYHSHRWQIKEDVKAVVNLRQMVYEGEWVPFTPSIGLEWGIYQRENNGLLLKGSASRNIKIPTLNDRFWTPGGNPDLLPEDSYSGEIGLVHQWEIAGVAFETELNHYRMLVDQWILWLPGESFWTPINIRKVNNKGLEASMTSRFSHWDWSFSSAFNYTYTRAQIAGEAEDMGRSLGNQLPYTPYHNLSGNLAAVKNKFSSWANYTYVGDRYVGIDNTTQVAGFTLIDVGVDYAWNLSESFTLKTGFQANNLFNQEYQVLRLRPMPGRNYQLHITLEL